VGPKGLLSCTGPGTGSAFRAKRPLILVASHRRSTNSGTASGPHQTMAFCSSRSPRSIACCREMPKTKRLGSPFHLFDGCCSMRGTDTHSRAFRSALNAAWRALLSASGCFLAERVPGRDEGAGLDLIRPVQGSKPRMGLANLQGQRRIGLDTVFRLQIGLHHVAFNLSG
jgi:hypothetical protein